MYVTIRLKPSYDATIPTPSDVCFVGNYKEPLLIVYSKVCYIICHSVRLKPSYDATIPAPSDVCFVGNYKEPLLIVCSKVCYIIRHSFHFGCISLQEVSPEKVRRCQQAKKQVQAILIYSNCH